jgi:acetyl esterase/lipase
MKIKLILILSLISCTNSFAQPYSKCWKDLDYGGDGNTYHKLDIYLPHAEKQLFPVVIVIYGSAWFSNNLKEMAFPSLGKPLLDAGFAVVTPNHRSSADAKFPAQINDIKAVIRFVRANAAIYQLDTTFIGITGFSSGGHLASLAGTSGGVKLFTVGSATLDIEGHVGQYPTHSSAVNAVVDWFGPIDISVMDSCKRSKDAHSPEAILIGGPIEDNLDQCALANPITYIDANDPPFLILHGDADPLVPLCQSELFFNALQKAIVPSQLVIVPGGQHGPGLFEETYYKKMTDFFLQVANKRQQIKTF